MKKILLFIAAIVSLYSCTKEELPAVSVGLSEWSYELKTHEQVRKGIKSITINKYSVEEKFGKQEKYLEESIVANYNKEGRIINCDNSEYEYIYYDNNKIKTIICYNFDSEHTEIISKIVNEFNEKGYLIKDIGYNENGIPSYPNWEHQYDEKGRIIETNGITYRSEPCKINYIYNEKGWVTEETTYESGSISQVKAYKYDKKGNCIEKIEYDSEGNVDSKVVFEHRGRNTVTATVYDGDGNMKYKTEYTPDETISYDESGGIDERIVFKNKYPVEMNSDIHICRIEYNKKGDCVKMTTYYLYEGKENVNAVTECEYTYY